MSFGARCVALEAPFDEEVSFICLCILTWRPGSSPTKYCKFEYPDESYLTNLGGRFPIQNALGSDIPQLKRYTVPVYPLIHQQVGNPWRTKCMHHNCPCAMSIFTIFVDRSKAMSLCWQSSCCFFACRREQLYLQRFPKQAVGTTVTQSLATQINEQRSQTRCPQMQSRALKEFSTEPWLEE